MVYNPEEKGVDFLNILSMLANNIRLSPEAELCALLRR